LIRAALAATALLAAACGVSSPSLLLVRHAEKGSGRDPDLTGEGRRRALALVEPSRDAGAAAAYHTQFKRAAQTAEPLATHLGIPLIRIDYTPGEESAHAEALLRHIRMNYPSQTVVVVGHTTTIPAILRALGQADAREIEETEYGTLFIFQGGATREVKFGP
jgi:broad specificity phosphatase PhoE